MKLAVVTPFYRIPRAWLQQCLDSVAAQSVPCTHFLVCDGDVPVGLELSQQVEVLRLPRPHEDVGNAARAIGSVSAICQGHEAIAYLDADNWYEPRHLELLVELHQRSQAAVCSANRLLHARDGTVLGACPEVDGEKFVDTNCLFLTKAAFGMVAMWYLLPRSQVEYGDRVLWRAVRQAKLTRAHLTEPTVHYRTHYAAHYRHFGLEPPPDARQVIITAPPQSTSKIRKKSGPRRPVAAPLDATPAVTPSLSLTVAASSPAVPPPAGTRQRVSLCLIVKNEAAHLADCLRPVRGLVDEIIVVDTGSTDRTRDLAREFGAQVFEYTWDDDFSAARNESLRHATGDWILWLDADERLDADNGQRLQRLLAQLPEQNCAYLMKQWSLPQHPGGAALVVEQVRLFRRAPEHRWRYRLHEQILLALRETGAQLITTDVVIHHLGYQLPQVRQHKLQRNLRLLHLEEIEQPDDAFVQFNLGGTYLDAGELEKALGHLERCLQLAPKGASFVPKVHVLLTQSHRNLGRLEEGLRLCERGLQQCPNEPELWFESGLLHQAQKDHASAVQSFEWMLQLPEQPCLVGRDPAQRQHLLWHHLALSYQELKRADQAEAHWQQALAACPGYGPAWLGLTELYLRQRRSQEIERLVQRLQNDDANRRLADVVQARVLLAQKRGSAARQLLEQALIEQPESVWLRLLLCDVLLRTGDPAAAEQQLQAILALEPRNRQALQRLQQMRERLETRV